MLENENIEVAVRLTLHELLWEVFYAQGGAHDPNGQQTLLTAKNGIVELMLKGRHVGLVTDEQKTEWDINARTITERLFDRAELRRQEIVAALGKGG